MEITYQHLTQQQIGPELFSGFDRWQNVTRCWRKENGSWVLRDISFIDDWNEEEYTFLYDCLKNTLNTGGDVIAALEGNRLLGFSVSFRESRCFKKQAAKRIAAATATIG